jgi:hypothetical protein
VIEVMVETHDGKHAVSLEEGRYFGWVFYKHPDGQWVTLRKATEQEIEDAKQARTIRSILTALRHQHEGVEE